MFHEETSFKDNSYLELWQLFVLWSRTICAIFVEYIMRNNSENFFEFGPVVQEEMPFKRHFLSSALAAPWFNK